MQFLIVIMIVRLIITLADNKTKKENITVTRNEVKDPAAFQLR
jgi:hypothetical protein